MELRTKKMIFGLDYYDLVRFYIEQGDMERAVAIALEGMANATGRKDELCEFMIKHLRSSWSYNIRGLKPAKTGRS